MNFDKQLFRCHNSAVLLSEGNARSKVKGISDTLRKELTKVFIRNRYGIEEVIASKYIEKGLAVEEDAITLLSRHCKTFYKKNEERISNDFVSGVPDLFIGKTILEAIEVIDIKASWDIFTFYNSINEPLNPFYYSQLQCYMWLTGARTSRLVYCLVSTPETIVNDQKRRLAWSMGLIDEFDNPDYVRASELIDLNSNFDRIPIAERIHERVIEFNPDHIEQLKERIIYCRKWLNETYGNLTELIPIK